MTPVSSDLASRYGSPRRGRRVAMVAVAAVVGAVFLAWLAWAAWFHATPEVRSELTSYKVLSAGQARAVIEVDVEEGAEDVRCTIRALAENHDVVAVYTFTPVDGANEHTFRTVREANSVTLDGCTAKGQQRPQ